MRIKTLDEAFKLRKLERNSIFREIEKDVLIGCEYEFEFSDDYDSNYNGSDYDQYQYSTEEALEKAIEAYRKNFEEIVDTEFLELAKKPSMKAIHDMSYLPSDKIDTATSTDGNYIGFLSKLTDIDPRDRVFTIMEKTDLISQLLDLVEDNNLMLYVIAFLELKTKNKVRKPPLDPETIYEKLSGEYGEKILDFYNAVRESKKRSNSTLLGGDELLIHQANYGLRKGVEKHLISNEFWNPENPVEDEDFAEYYDDALQELGANSGLDWLWNEFSTNITKHIENIESDSSLSNGAEIITHPITIEEQKKVFDTVASIINDYGYTDDNTGLHFNISIKGLRFDKMSFNPLKMFVLSEAINGNDRLWYDRNNNVERVLYKLSVHTLNRLAREFNKSGFKGIEEVLEGVIRTDKLQNINILNTDLVNYHRHRVEFRYTGGKNYHEEKEKFFDTVEMQTVVLTMAFSPTYRQKDYLKMVFRILDKNVARLSDVLFDYEEVDAPKPKTFSDFVKIYKENQ